ncbi:MAG: C45 family autoproteolytic acyltransferase/hydrolase [Candidatus Thorarchaeota archaeon]|jgi:hypothetical protein
MKLNDSVILDEEECFMTVRHLTLLGTNREIGLRLAGIAIERHGLNLDDLAAVDSLVAKNQKEYLIEKYPVHWERAQGVADAFGLDAMDAKYDTTRIPYNVELPAMPPPVGCSVAFYPPDTTDNGHGMLSRNYDFPTCTLAEMLGITLPTDAMGPIRPMMADPYVIEMYPKDGGYPSLSIVSFDLLSGALDGINSEGLVVSLNGDEIAMMQAQSAPNLNAMEVGIDETQVLRLLLDTCANVEEAKHVLLNTRHVQALVPCHYIIADKQGKSFVFEIGDQNKGVVIDGVDGPQVITNHPLYQYPTIDDMPEKTSLLEAGTSSFERYIRLERAIEETGPPYTLEFMKNACSEVSAASVISWTPEQFRRQLVASSGLSRTLWHCLYDTNDRTLSAKFYKNEGENDDGSVTTHYTDYHEFKLDSSA